MKGIPNMTPVKQKQSVVLKFIRENFKTTILPSIVTVVVAIFLIVITEPYIVPFFKDVIKHNEMEATVSEDVKHNLSKYYDIVVENKPIDPYDNTSKIETFVTMTLKKKYEKYESFLDDKMVITVKSVGKNGLRYEVPHDDNQSISQILWDSFETKTTLNLKDTLSQKQFSPNTFSEIERLFNEKSKPKQ